MECSSFGYCPLLLLLLVLSALRAPQEVTSASEGLQNGLKCHPAMTIVAPGVLTQTSLEAHGYMFSKGYYQQLNQTHFSICICKVTKCMRKCCLKNQVLYKRKCVDGYSYSVSPSVYDKELRLIHNYDLSRFVTVYGNTCKFGWYTLQPETAVQDTFFFLENGTLYLPYEEDPAPGIYGTDEFCFEHILKSLEQTPDTFSLRSMLCFPDLMQEEPISDLLPVGMIISIPFLLATFLVYSLPELRNLHGKNLMSHVGSLFVAYIVLVVVQVASKDLPSTVCIVLGYVIQCSFLASFFWLNVMCFDIWWAFSGFSALKGEKRSAEFKKYLLYSAYAWGCPAIISTVTVIMQFAPRIPSKLLKPDIGEHRCFFTDRKATLAYFYGPTAVILICDVVLFILTAIKIISVKKETLVVFKGKDSGRNKEASKQRYMLYLKLFLIMGVNWTMEVVSWAAEGPKWIWYFTDFANALQGLFVFITFVCTRRTRRLLTAKFCPGLSPKDTNVTTSSTKMSLSRNSSSASGMHNDVIGHTKGMEMKKIGS